jgi:adenosylcobinamide-phosphate synthase
MADPIGAAVLLPNPYALVIAVGLDIALGDPVYRAHPVRVIGRTLQAGEASLRARGADGYGGGILLFLALAVLWVGGLSLIVTGMSAVHAALGWGAHLFLLYSLLALGDLLQHGWRIERALGGDDLGGARRAVSNLVGRDTAAMDAGACRRAAVESLSESLTDGFTSPLFWYAATGIPGLVLFKVASTMDSMVGYKTERHLRFGWCGARVDDLLNYLPARLTWLLIAAAAAILPGCSARKALRVGLAQHAILPGPNAGWSEAATAGAVERRLVGPIWHRGRLVTDRWIGDPEDTPLATREDFEIASRLVALSGCGAAVCTAAFLVVVYG